MSLAKLDLPYKVFICNPICENLNSIGVMFQEEDLIKYLAKCSIGKNISLCKPAVVASERRLCLRKIATICTLRQSPIYGT